MPFEPFSPDSVSLVIPVYNERDSLPALLAEIDAATAGLAVQVIFVDDGSRDGSWDVIRGLAAKDDRVRAIRFRRNFGKAAALQAGFERATGGVVLTLDADLQDDPIEIPRFLEAIRGGRDVVSGYKQVRHDPWHKVLPSRVFNRMISALTGVRLHDHNCGFKAYRREVLFRVELYGELHRFVPVLAASKGYTVGELVVHHRPRKFGHSKFGARRFLKGFLDLLHVSARTAFGYRPMHLFGGLAVLAGLLAVPAAVGGFWLWPLWLLATALVVLGGQSALLGLAAEFALAHIHLKTPFDVAERIDPDDEPAPDAGEPF